MLVASKGCSREKTSGDPPDLEKIIGKEPLKSSSDPAASHFPQERDSAGAVTAPEYTQDEQKPHPDESGVLQ